MSCETSIKCEALRHQINYRSLVYSGPGCSSIGGGAFTELGPFYPKGNGRGLRRNSMSWNRGMSHSM